MHDGEGKQTRSFSSESVVSGWTKVMKERHSRACLAQQWRVFLHGHSLTNFAVIFSAVLLVPSKTAKFTHPWICTHTV